MNAAGEKIHTKRILLGLTFQVLSHRLDDVGVSISLLHRLEKGKWRKSPPESNVILRLAEELQLDAEQLTLDFEADRVARVKAKLLKKYGPTLEDV